MTSPTTFEEWVESDNSSVEPQNPAEVHREHFAQINASLALEGMIMDADDLAMQEEIIAGRLTTEEWSEKNLERWRKASPVKE